MPQGPQGHEQIADTISDSVVVSQSAVGTNEEAAYGALQKQSSGVAGAAAYAQELPPEVRQVGAKAAPKAKWKEDSEMITAANTDPLAGLLFGGEPKLVNLKMCRGDAPHVTSADLRNETHFALTQVSLGTCVTHADFPEDRNARRVDLTQL